MKVIRIYNPNIISQLLKTDFSMRGGHDLTLIEMIDRLVGLPLSRGKRVWS